MNNLLEIKCVNKSFDKFSLKDVSFSLPQGYIMGFIGPNGAGKTTTIKLILNMLKKDSGSINILGLDNVENEEAIKEDIAVIFDSSYFLEDWTLKDVSISMKLFYKNWNRETYLNYLEKFNLSIDKKIKELSKGMKMKLMIAAALSHDAKLLILDEPTSGLDPVARDEFLEILSDYIMDGTKSVLFSSHITSDLEKIADYITYIKGGRIIFSGTKDELLESYFIVKGGLEDLSPEIENKIIGLRRHSQGFDGLISADDFKVFSKNLLKEKSTLDDIIIYMNKEDYKNE